MPKIVDYPRASLLNSMELAEAVTSLGGNSTVDMAAERMNRKMSGAFTALVSSATKYGLLSSKSGKLTVQQTYRDYKLAYNDEEKLNALRIALLSPPLFRAIYDRFQSKPLPVEHFEKLLIREFEVPGDQASRIGMYFLEGANQAGLIGSGNVLLSVSAAEDSSESMLEPNKAASELRDAGVEGQTFRTEQSSLTDFAITFSGPGLNSTIIIAEEEDLLIVEAMLKKVKKALSSISEK
ncbi:MAG TPA: hypothetical protein VNZ27_15530 [Rhodanobacter sp.]|jgi:hypothetical protein|nr:hypothetical protein [Rhodanobacter sp.]